MKRLIFAGMFATEGVPPAVLGQVGIPDIAASTPHHHIKIASESTHGGLGHHIVVGHPAALHFLNRIQTRTPTNSSEIMGNDGK